MPYRFTSLLHPLEKLEEAEHFLGGLAFAENREFPFELNAFLSASRNVSFVLQKAMAGVPGFDSWYDIQRQLMKADPEMAFFLDLRNISQKEGPVSYVGGGRMIDGNISSWTYRFVASRDTDVPQSLRQRDIASCCAIHLSKLAKLLLACAEAFPFHACIGRAMTEEGMSALGFSFSDVETALGLPVGYTQIGEFTVEVRLRLFRREFYVLETGTIERIAKGEFERSGKPFSIQNDGMDSLDELTKIINDRAMEGRHPRDVFIASVLKRTPDTE